MKTWYAADALGSLRRTVTDAGVPLGVINYDPWGTVETGTVPTFGFTGEVQDASAGLVNLRARWYSTARGRFTSVDPFAGDPARPYSFHQYQYGFSDPVLHTDHSGRRPDPDGIKSDRYTYSCKCGWIDWNHANPQEVAARVIEQVNLAIAYFDDPGTDPSAERFLIPATKINHMFLGHIPTTINDVYILRGKVNMANKYQVALGIFQWVEENHESSSYSWLSQVANFFPGGLIKGQSSTYYSEEDLASDLLAFYGAVNGKSNLDDMKSFLASICDFPSDRSGRIEKSREAYAEYVGKNNSNNFTPIHEWGKPRFFSSPCIDARCGPAGSRAWPSILNTIQPIRGYDLYPYSTITGIDSKAAWLIDYTHYERKPRPSGVPIGGQPGG